MKPIVRCSVSNCEYWGKGNHCNAEEIKIDIDEHATHDFNTEFASDDETRHDLDGHDRDEASGVSGTCCHTFEPKRES